MFRSTNPPPKYPHLKFSAETNSLELPAQSDFDASHGGQGSVSYSTGRLRAAMLYLVNRMLLNVVVLEQL
ncbi:hypothetical protein V5O48_018813 [Marasmius crinis-equi]|uniref:Uncharacterized protein n=1 Tax=Marasmius crinis-equi TaxID=585013 RepID=A0ABR3EK54_9AGAR